mmetsp:Transcript_41303/g.106882  ORF Transcript_41303/g.106882 Transcript_41303/m.106882 type:complete len:340 (-) Transcript_41303:247-1266(-)
MLKDVTYDVVAVLILRQAQGDPHDALEDAIKTGQWDVLQKPLDDTAAVDVRRHDLHTVLDRIGDEDHGVRRHLLNAFLHNIVAMHALDAVDDAELELPGDLRLQLGRGDLNRLLDNSAAIHAVRQLEYLATQLVHDGPTLLTVAGLQQLCHHLAARGVAAETRHLWQQRLPQCVALHRLSRVKSRLQQPAALHIACQLAGVGDDVLHGQLARPGACAAHLADHGTARGVLGATGRRIITATPPGLAVRLLLATRVLASGPGRRAGHVGCPSRSGLEERGIHGRRHQLAHAGHRNGRHRARCHASACGVHLHVEGVQDHATSIRLLHHQLHLHLLQELGR